MGWQLTNFELDPSGRLASTFHFEIVFTGSRQQPECLVRGDGVLLRSGRVRFNREDDLRSAVEGVGVEPHGFISHLADWVVQQSMPRVPQPA